MDHGVGQVVNKPVHPSAPQSCRKFPPFALTASGIFPFFPPDINRQKEGEKENRNAKIPQKGKKIKE